MRRLSGVPKRLVWSHKCKVLRVTRYLQNAISVCPDCGAARKEKRTNGNPSEA